MSRASQRQLSRLQPCAVCSATIRTPAGSDAEYAIALPTDPPIVTRREHVVTVAGPPPCYLVCNECAARARHNPGGVRESLRERYGDQYATWTTPASLAPMLDEAAAYLASREARDGVDFGTWQKMQDWV